MSAPAGLELQLDIREKRLSSSTPVEEMPIGRKTGPSGSRRRPRPRVGVSAQAPLGGWTKCVERNALAGLDGLDVRKHVRSVAVDRSSMFFDALRCAEVRAARSRERYRVHDVVTGEARSSGDHGTSLHPALRQADRISRLSERRLVRLSYLDRGPGQESAERRCSDHVSLLVVPANCLCDRRRGLFGPAGEA